MKYLILVLSSIFVFSCQEPSIRDAVNSMLHSDRQLPRLSSSRALSETEYEFIFSEDITVRSAICNERSFSYEMRSSARILVTFNEKLDLAKAVEFYLAVEDRSGNISSFILSLTGKNSRIPKLMINEISPNGSDTQPDRIEIIALTDGNTEGIYAADGTKGNEQFGFVLPSIDMKQGDMILLYWNTNCREESYINSSQKRTYTLRAGSSTGLSGTNGVFVLYDMKAGDGKILDAIIYSDFKSTAHSGYGTSRVEASANEIVNSFEWIGQAVDSSHSTSTRTISRRMGLRDSNTANDFYTTVTRGQTFGEANISQEYVVPE